MVKPLISPEADEAYEKVTKLAEEAEKKMATTKKATGPNKVVVKKGQTKPSGGKVILALTQTVEIPVKNLLRQWEDYFDTDQDPVPDINDAQSAVDAMTELGDACGFGRRQDSVLDFLREGEYLHNPSDYEIEVEFVK